MTGPKGLEMAVRSIWVDSQDLATILDPFRTILVILGPTSYLRLQHLSCLNSRHLSQQTSVLSQQQTSVLSQHFSHDLVSHTGARSGADHMLLMDGQCSRHVLTLWPSLGHRAKTSGQDSGHRLAIVWPWSDLAIVWPWFGHGLTWPSFGHGLAMV